MNFQAEKCSACLSRVPYVKIRDILLCDEPTGALDSATGRSVLQLLTDMARKYNKTVIIVTHNASIALCANEVIHLKDGRIEFSEKNENPLKVDEVNW